MTRIVAAEGIIHLVRTKNFPKKVILVIPLYVHIRVVIINKKC